MLSKSWNVEVTDGYQGEVRHPSVSHGFGNNRQLLIVPSCVYGRPLAKKIFDPDL